MSRLIVGHVAHQSARIWVRGSKTHPVAELEVRGSGGPLSAKPITLEERHFFTGVFEVDGLAQDEEYSCSVTFLGAQDSTQRFVPKYASGAFRTSPTPGTQTPFKFLLLSCNLHSLGVVTSPDAAYRKLSAMGKESKARFAIHAGDQIYYDVPRWGRDPDVDDYRNTYLDAWEDCEPAAEFLTELPHYMILDDHEIIDNFANDHAISSGSPPYLQLALATKAYREFQHMHNPQSFGSGPLYYKFDAGNAHFFVFDTRTERYGKPPGNQMISPEQLGRFRSWLKANSAEQLFVVSSVPFVTNVRQSDDKWSSQPYRAQREQILDLIWKFEARRVCFLTGDMHNSHHATLTLSGDGQSDIVVHELMSSPVNQLGKNRIDKYATGAEPPVDQKLPFRYSTRIVKKEFFTGHSSAMVISVTKAKVGYEVYRTKKEAMKVEMSGTFAL